MIRTRALLLLAVLAPVPSAAQYDESAPVATRPAYRTLRFEEDWSVLRDPDALPSHDFFDPIKFIPLSRDEKTWIGFGGNARLRGEGWSNYQFGAPRDAEHDDGFLLTRMRAYADLHVGDRARAFLELKSSLATEVDLPGGRTNAKVDTFAVQNGFLELIPLRWPGHEVQLRVGRQELLFGAQRLVSPSDWSNVRRTFDGVTLAVQAPGAHVTGFFMRPVVVEKYDWNDYRGGDRFYGIYAAAQSPPIPFGLGIDLYWLGLDRGNRTINGTSGDEHRHTIGTRIHGPIGETNFDAELETALQVGSLGGRTLTAGMVSAELGWWQRAWWAAPRFHLGLDWASGDRDPGGSVQTFDPLFTTGHKFFGELDAVGRLNVAAVSAGVTLRPLPATTARLSVYRFWRASKQDALYDAANAVLRPGSASRARAVGTEFDLVLGYRLDPHTQLGFGWAHFFPDSFLQSSGPAQTADFVYLWIEVSI